MTIKVYLKEDGRLIETYENVVAVYTEEKEKNDKYAMWTIQTETGEKRSYYKNWFKVTFTVEQELTTDTLFC